MFEWELYWPSTPGERFDGVMLPKADALVNASGLKVVDRFGGSLLGVPNDTADAADNGYVVVAPDDDTVLKLTRDLTEALGKTVRVTQLEAVGG